MPRLCGPIVLLLGLSSAALGHDIPNERVDRAIQVELAPGRLRIDYEVSLAELTLAQDLRNLLGTVPGADRSELFDRYGRETAPLNARGLLVTVDGGEFALRVEGFDLAVEEHPRFTFHFVADLLSRGRLVVQDTNYAASEGTSRLALRATPSVRVRGYDGPAAVADVPIRPVWMLTDAEERATKRVEVEFESPGTAGAPAEVAERSPPATRRETSATSPARGNGLTRLLDRSAAGSTFGLWLLAVLLGSAHAIQPGHGKTLVAAATVGAGRGWLWAVGLALVTTLAHFTSVLLIAWAVWASGTTRYAQIHVALAGLAGFAIAAVGLWRLGRHLAGLGEHEVGQGTILDRGLLSLGLAGGMVPCWDAIVLVLLADLAGRLALGVWLLSGFSLGMALVLVAVGLAAGKVRGLAAVGESSAWERRLGIVSGLALAGIGVYLLMS